MAAPLQRYAIDSRKVLRWYARFAAFFGFALLPIGVGFRLTAPGRAIAVLSFGMVLAVSGLLVLSFVAGTIAQIEDPQVRRRMCAGFLLSHAFVVFGIVLYACAPVPVLGRFLGHDVPWLLLFWFPTQWCVFNGIGTGADALLARWIGDLPAGPDSQARARDKEIRAAASQEERNRLARDLHDSIKQEIFAIHTSAATAQARFDGDAEGAKRALEQVRASARDAMTEMEAMLDRLHATPLENTGLETALRRQCDALALRTGAEVACDIKDLPPSKALATGAHEALLRIAQEALSNIARHARATKVRLTLAKEGSRLELTIHDDGAGFDQGPDGSRGGMGIANMRARAREVGATFTMNSEPGRGTTVRAYLTLLHVADDFWPTQPYLRWALVVLLLPLPIGLAVVMWHAGQFVMADPELGPQSRGTLPAVVVICAIYCGILYLRGREKLKTPWLP